MAYEDIIASFGERYGRLFLFEPLHKLERMKQTDQQGTPIDMRGLGILTLLFFFEQKIIRQMKVGTTHLATFLAEVTQGVILLSEEEFQKLARTIIQTFRPGSGEKMMYAFYNWETQQEEQISYQYLRASSFNSSTQEQYYTLDEHGLELVFATKEFYSEFQLSISQLVLRKQLEKGEFKGALRQINEMRVAVESIEARLERLQREIRRNIVSHDVFMRYQKTMDDTSYRLKYENEEFEQLEEFVREAKERLHDRDTSQKEREAYRLVLTIGKELEAVHAEHTQVFEKSIHVKNVALKAAKEALYSIGVERFNFDKDITSQMISKPLPIDALPAIAAPFLRVEQNRQWSLLTILGKQNIYEERMEKEPSAMPQFNQQRERAEQQEMKRYYVPFMTLLIEVLKRHRTMTLKQWIEQLKQHEKQHVLLDMRYFYDFFILLHQRSPIQRMEVDEKYEHLWGALQAVLGEATLYVEELPDIIHVNERFTIQNMTVTMKEDGL